jgi:tripartite-type tricarboxylate transporter receptor subunit TctC
MRRKTLFAAVALILQVAPTEARDAMTLVVGFAPGGTSSVAARFIAHAIEKFSEMTIVVENKPGAGGEIAADWVKRQKEDQTLLFMSSTSVLKVSPDGLVPIGMLATFSYVAVPRSDAPKTLIEYMTATKRNDSLRSVATAGAGSVPHLIGERLFQKNGVKMEHIPFQGSAPAISAVAGKHVGMAIVPAPDFVPFRDKLDVIAETGSGIETEGWIGILAPSGVAPEKVASLTALFQRASKETAGQLAQFGFRSTWRSADEMRKIHAREYADGRATFKSLGISP